MGIGAVGIVTNQKKEGSGAPFPAGSADNGLSVDSVTGKIVLGNDAFGNDAELLSTRIIPMDGNSVVFQQVPFSIFVEISGSAVSLQTATSNVNITETGMTALRSIADQANISLGNILQILTMGVDAAGNFLFNSAIAGLIGQLDLQFGKWQVGINPGGAGVFNGAQLEVVGSLTYDAFVDQAGGAVLLSEINDKGKVFTDQGGAATFTLPGSSAAVTGLHFMFCVQAGNGITVQADLGTVIILNNVVSNAGGTATANVVGSFLHLMYVGNNQWIAPSVTGAWIVA